MTPLNDQWKNLRRYGTILQREDSELVDGWYTLFWLKDGTGVNANTWCCEMKNGKVLSLQRV